jgi:glycosyltransferase involved in cell wall biosynthesis
LDDLRRSAARASLDLTDAESLFVYLGAIGVANGLDILIDAIKLVPPSVPARFVIAGDGSARHALAETVKAGGLGRLKLLPPMPRDKMDDLLAAADVGLHLLRPDPVFESALPSKLLDYLGARLPFITTVGGLPKQIALDSGGAAVTSAAELAGEIERWTTMTGAERRKRGQQAFAYGLREFGLDAGVSRLEGMLAELLASPPGEEP